MNSFSNLFRNVQGQHKRISLTAKATAARSQQDATKATEDVEGVSGEVVPLKKTATVSRGAVPGAPRPLDRRARYTRAVIREAFYELLREKGFEKMTVSDLCRQAQINRGTFYLHYEDKYELLNALIDEALDADPLLDGTPAALCQRAPVNSDYRLLYHDPAVFPFVAARVIERGAAEAIPSIMEKTGLGEADAHILFIYTAHGNLAVNQALNWQKGTAFNRAQALVSSFTEAGFKGVRER